jgi:hypothetical protein
MALFLIWLKLFIAFYLVAQPVDCAPHLSDTQYMTIRGCYACLQHPKVKEPSSGTKRKRRWDISELTDENADPNKQD